MTDDRAPPPRAAAPCCTPPTHRRHLLKGALALLLGTGARDLRAAGNGLPGEVAGIALPATALALRALKLARDAYPNYLFNHCMRTYLFGALALRSQHTLFDPQIAFVAATLHDLGLVPAYASERASFEIDGATRAEALMVDSGRCAEEARRVWNAIVAHDMRADYAAHQSTEAVLVNIGAGADVVDPGRLDPAVLREILGAFPRLRFKMRFTALVEDHCRRKPTSQIGWLDGLCRQLVPGAPRSPVEQAIRHAPFPE